MLADQLRSLWQTPLSAEDAALLDAHWVSFENLWPGVVLPAAVYAGWVRGRAPSPADAKLLLLGDLFIACACAEGNPLALELLERNMLRPLDSTIGRISPTQIDEVASALRERLFTGKQPRIATYGGRGSLQRWLKAVATRLALDLQEKSEREEPTSVSAIGLLAVDTGDAELEALKKNFAEPLTAAMRSALEQLVAEDRALLREYYLDGLGLETIAKRRNVAASTISRRLAKARDQLSADVRRALTSSLGAQVNIESLVRGVHSQLQLSRSMFGDE